jgi:hypothetical protein
MMAGMCRSIKILRRPEQAATREEISAAALQFVRKVSGFRQPSRANQMAFDAAVVEIGDSVEKLLEKIGRQGSAARVGPAILPADSLSANHDG